MATIRKRGKGQWQVEIRKKGVRVTKTFYYQKDAQEWAHETERQIDDGSYQYQRLSESMSLHDALMKYQKEICPTKKGKKQELQKISFFIKHNPELIERPLNKIRPPDLVEFRDRRLKEGRAAATVKLDLALISHLYSIARKEWGMYNLINPIEGIRKPKVSNERDRRLIDDEEERLIAEANKHNPYMSPLIQFAIATAMRRGEMLDIRWKHIDFSEKMATLEDTKNGDKRIVPLNKEAMDIIRSLPRSINSNHFVFNITGNAVSIAWRKITKNAGIQDLRFHDLRHEAISRLFERGLTITEVRAISGHRSLQMLIRYTHLKPADILKKMEGAGG